VDILRDQRGRKDFTVKRQTFSVAALGWGLSCGLRRICRLR
jgi:hypothetical protein